MTTTKYNGPANFPNMPAKVTPVAADLVQLADSANNDIPVLGALGALPMTFINGVNTQTISYSTVTSDIAKVIFYNNAASTTTTYTVTLLAPATATAGWWCYIDNQNLSALASVLLSPASGTINGSSSFYITPGNSALVYTDGSNYFLIANYLSSTLSGQGMLAAMPGILGSTASNSQSQSLASTLNTAVVAWPFLMTNNALLSSVYIDATTSVAASTATVGIYPDNGQNTEPASVAALGAVSIATTSNGPVTATFSPKIQLYANRIYWCALQASTATTLSLGCVNMNYSIQPAGTGSASFTAGTTILQQTHTYGAGTLPTWSVGGSSGLLVTYLPWVQLNFG